MLIDSDVDIDGLDCSDTLSAEQRQRMNAGEGSASVTPAWQEALYGVRGAHEARDLPGERHLMSPPLPSEAGEPRILWNVSRGTYTLSDETDQGGLTSQISTSAQAAFIGRASSEERRRPGHTRSASDHSMQSVQSEGNVLLADIMFPLN